MQPLARRLLRRPAPVRWGNLRRTTPFSDYFGFERGLPIDRFYIERFLERFAADIRGHVLEVHDSTYTRAYGDDVRQIEIVDIDPANPRATLIADLGEPDSLPAERYDCAIVTQTLQYVSDPRSGLQNLWRSLARDGVALITVPTVTRVDPNWRAVDAWRLTPRGLETLLRQSCPAAAVEVFGFGNVLAGVAFLMGIAAEELDLEELEGRSEDFDIVACARLCKAAGTPGPRSDPLL